MVIRTTTVKPVVVEFSSHEDYIASRRAEADKLRGQPGGIKAAAEGRIDLFRVNPFLIDVVPGFNIREIRDEEKDLWLKNDIARTGVLTPLIVRASKDGRYLLRSGHRRLEAVLKAIQEGAQIDTIPVQNEGPGFNDEAEAIAAIYRHNSGEPMHVIDQAKGLLRLKNHGWSEEKIELKTSFPPDKQKRMLALLDVAPEIMTHVVSGMISPTDALKEFRGATTEAAAIEKIETRVANARAVGAKRATAKHDGEIVTPKKVGQTFFRTVEAEGGIDKSGKVYKLTAEVTPAQWEQIAKVFGL